MAGCGHKRVAALCALLALLVLVPAAQATIATRPLATWQTNGRVNAIMQIGAVTYVGGKFTQVSDHAGHTATVSNLAAFNANGDFVTGWLPSANGTVKTIANDGSGGIVVGGSFTKVNGSGRPHIAKLLADGTLVAKATFAAEANGDVQALATSGGTLYMGGQFATVDGQSRAFLGAVSAANGTIDSSWTPFVDGRVDGLEVVGGSVVAGGFFLNAGSASGGHPSIAAFDATNGTLQSGWTGHSPTSAVVSMAVGGDGSIYAGHFNNRMEKLTPTGGSSWQVRFDGNVQAIGVSDGEVIAGGHFQNFCPGMSCTAPVARHHIAAFDPSNGDLDTSWAPSVNSDLGVFALADTSTGLAVGGDFTRIGGADQAHLAFLATGSSVPIDSTPPAMTRLPNAILRKATTIASGRVPLLVRWGATDPSGVCSYALQTSANGGRFGGIPLANRMATSRAIALTPSTTAHVYQVRATDCVGNASAFKPGLSTRVTAFQDGNGAIRYAGGWTRSNAPQAWGNTTRTTARRGASATLRFTGRQVAYVATRRGNRGIARVYVDGKLLANVNLHSATRVHRRLVFAHSWATDGTHTIKVVCAGTAGHARIDVDAFVTIR